MRQLLPCSHSRVGQNLLQGHAASQSQAASACLAPSSSAPVAAIVVPQFAAPPAAPSPVAPPTTPTSHAATTTAAAANPGAEEVTDGDLLMTDPAPLLSFTPSAALSAALAQASAPQTAADIDAVNAAATSEGRSPFSAALLDPDMFREPGADTESGLRIVTRRDSDDSDEDEDEERRPDCENHEVRQTETDQGKSGKKRTRVNRRADTSLTEAEQRSIWLNLAESHSYAMSKYQYELNAEERLRLAKRNTWRLVEQVSRLISLSNCDRIES
ncbi:hypothetical protein OC835_007513 [Tilletia horrida]|nr:hypothetical protein OC835_007513 [Tilletia horrida]